MPVTKKIAQHREYKDLQLQIGRDDPNNILGSHKISSIQPQTTRDRKKTPNVVSQNQRNYGDFLTNSKR